jgi:hypothetical protein
VVGELRTEPGQVDPLVEAVPEGGRALVLVFVFGVFVFVFLVFAFF